MDLNQLRYFITIAELQNISKAARRLNMSQPSLSKSIAKLEKELGTPLFERIGKKIVLNEHGSRFLAGVQSSLQELDDTLAVISNAQASIIPKINIGIFAYHSQIITCLKKFEEIYPRVEFIIYSNIGILDQIETDVFDMMVYPHDPVLKKYKGYTIAHEGIKLVVSNESSIALKKKVSFTDLKDQQFVFIRNSRKSLEHAFYLCAQNGFRPQIKCTTDSQSVHQQLISSGMAVGFITEGMIQTYADDPSIVILELENEDFIQSVMLGFKREKHLTDAGRVFRNYLMEYFKIMVGRE